MKKGMKRFLTLILSLLLAFSLFYQSGSSPGGQAWAASVKIKYTYHGKKKTYTGKSRKIVYNGETVSMSQTPILVLDGCNMAPYYETFVKGTIKAKKTYTSSTKNLVIEGNGHKIEMTLDSTTAYVDGAEKTLGACPRMITYEASEKERILVPLKAVSQALGLFYAYSSDTGIIRLSDTAEGLNTDTQVPSVARSGELKAMWISYLEFEGYLKTYSPSKANFTKFIRHVYDKCAKNNMNAVIVHVRPFGDALYDSSYFPWSKYISGKQGKNPGFDPLAIMVEEAHKRNLEFHAWLNPYRVSFSSSYSSLSSDNPARKWHNKSSTKRNVLSFGGKLYYNPAKSQVRNLIINGVKEIVKNYDVDGIHFDDYFYPSFSSGNVKKAFDAKEYNSYKKKQKEAGNSYKSIYNWRRANVNQLVSGIYHAVKEIDPDVEFGISPAGNIDNLKSNYSYYVDIDSWLGKTGYVDYIMPQIYWGFTHKTAAYDKVLKRWINLNKKGIVDLYVGIGAYKVGMAKSSAYSDWKEWQRDTSLLADQVVYGRKTGKVKGYAFFSYEYFDASGNIRFSSRSFSSSRKSYLSKSIKQLRSVLK